MSAQRASLKPYVEEIREWVSQGYTDVWIAHTLNSTPSSIASFRSENGILRRDVATETRAPDAPPPVLPADAEEPQPEKPKRRRRRKAEPGPEPAPVASAPAEDEDGEPRKRRRRGGRGRSKRPSVHTYEAVLDHGDDEGYGFWMDGAVRDDTIFAEHWARRRGVVVKIEADQIVIRPADAE